MENGEESSRRGAKKCWKRRENERSKGEGERKGGGRRRKGGFYWGGKARKSNSSACDKQNPSCSKTTVAGESFKLQIPESGK